MTVSIELRRPSRQGLRAWALLLLPAFALGLALGLLPSGRVALACSCTTPPPPAQALAAAGLVFDGTAIRVENLDPERPVNAQLRVRFAVHTQWKGVTSGDVTLLTGANSAMCGFHFQLGARYIVYTDTAVDPHASLCSRTALYDPAEAAALGPSSPPPGAAPVEAWHGDPPSRGCPRCAPPPPPLEALDKASAVFHGPLQALEFLGSAQAHDHLATFQNLGWWKGPADPTITVRLPWSVWDCYSFWDRDFPWADYLVYAEANEGGGLKLSLCDRTRRYEDAEEDLAALGPPNQPLTATPTGTANPNETPSATPTLSATPMDTPTATPSRTPVCTQPSCPCGRLVGSGCAVVCEPGTCTATPTFTPLPGMTCTPPACPCGRLVGECPNIRCEVCTATPTGTWRPPPAYLPWGEKR